MWKPDVQGREKIQRAFKNGESHNAPSEPELFLSTVGPGEGQGAMGLHVGVRNKAHCSRHGMGPHSNMGGKGDELGLPVGPHFPCSQQRPSTTTMLVLTSLIPGTSMVTASVAAALGSILCPADVASVTTLRMSPCSNSSRNRLQGQRAGCLIGVWAATQLRTSWQQDAAPMHLVSRVAGYLYPSLPRTLK